MGNPQNHTITLGDKGGWSIHYASIPTSNPAQANALKQWYRPILYWPQASPNLPIALSWFHASMNNSPLTQQPAGNVTLRPGSQCVWEPGLDNDILNENPECPTGTSLNSRLKSGIANYRASSGSTRKTVIVMVEDGDPAQLPENWQTTGVTYGGPYGYTPIANIYSGQPVAGVYADWQTLNTAQYGNADAYWVVFGPFHDPSPTSPYNFAPYSINWTSPGQIIIGDGEYRYFNTASPSALTDFVNYLEDFIDESNLCPTCGDGVPDVGEECDDGNLINTDACKNNCELPVCGDSIITPSLGEQCDDGGTTGGDGCSAFCLIEAEPWLMVDEGHISANGGIPSITIPNNNINIPDVYTGTANLATSAFAMSGNNSLPSARISSENTYIRNYTNTAITLPPTTVHTTWYDFLLERVTLNNNDIPPAVTTQTTISGSISTNLSATPNSKTYRVRTGNMTLNSGAQCNIQGIIFINGNLTINPDFINAASNSNGCIFVVSGNVTVNAGTAKTNLAITSPTLASYDIFEGFIVTDGTFTVVNDPQAANRKWDGFRLNGGVYANAVSLTRDLNTSANYSQPALIFQFNPRLREIFRADLSFRFYSVREPDTELD